LIWRGPDLNQMRTSEVLRCGWCHADGQVGGGRPWSSKNGARRRISGIHCGRVHWHPGDSRSRHAKGLYQPGGTPYPLSVDFQPGVTTGQTTSALQKCSNNSEVIGVGLPGLSGGGWSRRMCTRDAGTSPRDLALGLPSCLVPQGRAFSRKLRLRGLSQHQPTGRTCSISPNTCGSVIASADELRLLWRVGALQPGDGHSVSARHLECRLIPPASRPLADQRNELLHIG
jgi:hypothetical protein